MIARCFLFIVALLAVCHSAVGDVSAQVLGQPQEQDLQINLADKADLDLAALVQFLSDKKQMKIVANSDRFPGNQSNKVLFFGDVRVTTETLVDVVQSVLRTNGFALVKSDVAGLYQVVELANVRPFTQIIVDENMTDLPRSEYVTGVFPLKEITHQQALAFVKQLMYATNDKALSNIASIPNQNTLVVTETAQRLAAIKTLLVRIDRPATQLIREFYRTKNLQAEELRQQLTDILGLGTSTAPAGNPTGEILVKPKLKVDAILRTNQLLLSGTKSQITEAISLLGQLDVADELQVKNYQFQNVSAERIDELVRQSLANLGEDQAKSVYQSNVNKQANQLIATTREEIHQRIEGLKLQLDNVEAAKAKRSPMRFYTLKNVKAIEMLDTLQAIESRVTARSRSGRDSQRLNGINALGGNGNSNSTIGNVTNGIPPNQIGANFGSQLGSGLAGSQSGQNLGAGRFGDSVIGDIARLANEVDTAEKLIPGEAKVTVDENTNTLIVVAEPAVQQLYAELIARLDVRRPQVLIEVKLVTISGQDDLQLGLEVSGGDRTGRKRAFAFTQFNLSELGTDAATTGAITLSPGLGFNGALIDTAAADVILRALSRHRRAKVITAPRILVNDNATGLLSSVAEVPFQTNSIGNTVALSSFGGFAQAGTIISVTPQISEDDYLNLEFDVQVNAFTGEAVDGSPPPRNTDQVTSEVSIPDGSTIIVGGLTRKRDSSDEIGIPFIENIPLLRKLARSTSETDERQRLFVFIKPIILRDDKFRDLRYLSEEEVRSAKIPTDLPQSQPILIR